MFNQVNNDANWVKHASADKIFLENFYHDYHLCKTKIILNIPNLKGVIKLQQMYKSS